MLMCEFRLVSRRYVTSILIKPKRMIAGYGQTEGNKEIVRRVEELAKKKGYTMAQIACAWVMAKDPVAAPIVGTTSLKNLQELIGKAVLNLTTNQRTLKFLLYTKESVHIKLANEEIDYLEEAYQPMAVFGHA